MKAWSRKKSFVICYHSLDYLCHFVRKRQAFLLKPVLVARTAIMKYHRLGTLNNRDLFPHSSKSQKHPTSGCWQVWVLLRALCLACRQLPSCWVLTWPFLCAHTPLVSLCAQTSSSFKDSSQTGLGPTSWPYLNLIISLQALSLNIVTCPGTRV